MGRTGIKYRLKSEYVTELKSQVWLVFLGNEQILKCMSGLQIKSDVFGGNLMWC